MCSDERREPAALAIAADREGCGSTADVVLISMPFGPLLTPSIALGLLKASLAPRGISTKTLYFSLWFAERIGTRLYRTAAHSTSGTLAGEWIFASALFPQVHPDTEGYLHGVLEAPRSAFASKVLGAQPEGATELNGLLEARGKVDRFLDDCLERVIACRPRIVGFTSVFQQHVASLAAGASGSRQRAPDIFIVFGGANCEGVMGAEAMRQFPFVDAVVSGEGDMVFADLVDAVLAGDASIEGCRASSRRASVARFRPGDRYAQTAPMVARHGRAARIRTTAILRAVRGSRSRRMRAPTILFETSRGCWWGERMHCTFCGLNGATMAYRSKSAPRALDELRRSDGRLPGLRHPGRGQHPRPAATSRRCCPELAARRLERRAVLRDEVESQEGAGAAAARRRRPRHPAGHRELQRRAC